MKGLWKIPKALNLVNTAVLINLEKVRTSIMGDDAILENQIPKITF